jgi:hypothetical protein
MSHPWSIVSIFYSQQARLGNNILRAVEFAAFLFSRNAEGVRGLGIARSHGVPSAHAFGVAAKRTFLTA